MLRASTRSGAARRLLRISGVDDEWLVGSCRGKRAGAAGGDGGECGARAVGPHPVGPGQAVDQPGRAAADAPGRDGDRVAGRRRRGDGAARCRHRRQVPQRRAARAGLRQPGRCGDRLRQPAAGDCVARPRRQRRCDLHFANAAVFDPKLRLVPGSARPMRATGAEVSQKALSDPATVQGHQRLGGGEDTQPHSLDHRQRRRPTPTWSS